MIWGITLISTFAKTVEQTLREKLERVMELNNEHQCNETTSTTFLDKITRSVI